MTGHSTLVSEGHHVLHLQYEVYHVHEKHWLNDPAFASKQKQKHHASSMFNEATLASDSILVKSTQ